MNRTMLNNSAPGPAGDARFVAAAVAAVRRAPIFVGLCDTQLRPHFLNDAGRELIGLPVNADITVYRMGDFFTPPCRSLLEEVGLPAMLRDGQWDGELCLRHLADPAKQTEMEWSIAALHDDAGQLIGAAAFATGLAAGPSIAPQHDPQAPFAAVLDALPVGVGVSLLEATLSSIPDYVYAFNRQRRFVYANPATLALFNLPASEMLGRNFTDLGYPDALSDRLNAHIDRVFNDGVTVEDEVSFRSQTGYSAYFAFLWGPVRAGEGSVELVVGVSRDTTERRAVEEALRKNETRLRAATELVGLAIYSWDPVTGELDWDERLRAMWGLPADAPVDMDVYEAGICAADRARVRDAIAACVDPAGEGRYTIEYRVIGRDDGIVRHIATSGRTTFQHGRAVGFIGAAIDVTAQRRAEAAIRASEAQFRSFAEHSSNLIWIGDAAAGTIIYRSAAFEKIWGVADEDAPTAFEDWIGFVHRDDRQQVERALAIVRSGEAAQYEYRIFRPDGGTIRWLRDTSFPIRDENGAVIRIGGITEDLTPKEIRQAYLVSTKASQTRRLVTLVRGAGYRAQTFDSAAAFLDIAPVLAPGCVLVDLRGARLQGLSIPRELKARSIALSAILLDGPAADVGSAVAAMKAGAVDYLIAADDGRSATTSRTRWRNATIAQRGRPHGTKPPLRWWRG